MDTKMYFHNQIPLEKSNTLAGMGNKIIFLLIIFTLYIIGCNNVEKAYYETGELKYEAKMVGGEKDGAYVEYHKNGEIKYVATYNNGMLDGKLEEFDEQGRMVWVYEYQEGKRNGIAYGYYTSGEIRSELNYSNDSISGLWTSYYKNGSIEGEYNYLNDSLHGATISYFPNGEVKRFGEWENGITLYLKTLDESGAIVDEYRKIDISPEFGDTIYINTNYQANVEIFGPPLDTSTYFVGYAITKTNFEGNQEVVRLGSVRMIDRNIGVVNLIATNEEENQTYDLGIHILEKNSSITKFISYALSFYVKGDGGNVPK